MINRVLTPGLVLLSALLLPIGASPVQADQPRQPTSWVGIISRIFQKAKQPGTSRPDQSICVIAPTSSGEVWDLQPTVAWIGRVGAIGLRDVDTQTILWKTSPQQNPHGLNHVRSLPVLQPEHSYEWVIYDPLHSDSPIYTQPFQVLDPDSRTQITADLAPLEPIVGNPESLRMQRAQYFIDRDLTADALQEVFTLQRPSAELRQLLTNLSDPCQSSAPKDGQAP